MIIGLDRRAFFLLNYYALALLVTLGVKELVLLPNVPLLSSQTKIIFLNMGLSQPLSGFFLLFLGTLLAYN